MITPESAVVTAVVSGSSHVEYVLGEESVEKAIAAMKELWCEDEDSCTYHVQTEGGYIEAIMLKNKIVPHICTIFYPRTQLVQTFHISNTEIKELH